MRKFKSLSLLVSITNLGLPLWLSSQESVCTAGEAADKSLGWEDLLEEGMATHSSILVWTIPWTEEAGGLKLVGLQSQTHLKQLSRSTSVAYNLPYLLLFYPFIINFCKFKILYY